MVFCPASNTPARWTHLPTSAVLRAVVSTSVQPPALVALSGMTKDQCGVAGLPDHQEPRWNPLFEALSWLTAVRLPVTGSLSRTHAATLNEPDVSRPPTV